MTEKVLSHGPGAPFSRLVEKITILHDRNENHVTHVQEDRGPGCPGSCRKATGTSNPRDPFRIVGSGCSWVSPSHWCTLTYRTLYLLANYLKRSCSDTLSGLLDGYVSKEQIHDRMIKDCALYAGDLTVTSISVQ